jgi:hypothetical protein
MNSRTRLLLVVFAIALSYHAHSQEIATSRFRNAIRLGANYLTLDLPDNAGLHYQGQYIRYSKNKRGAIIGSAGYLATKSEKDPLRPFNRKRITTDVTVAIAPFKTGEQHSFRVGVGISAWYRDDAVVERSSFTVKPDGTYDSINLQMRQVKAIDVGPHCIAEYEYKSQSNFTGTLRFGLANLGRAGYSSMLGVAIGRRF